MVVYIYIIYRPLNQHFDNFSSLKSATVKLQQIYHINIIIIFFFQSLNDFDVRPIPPYVSQLVLVGCKWLLLRLL